MKGYNEILSGLASKGNGIMDALTQKTNCTIDTPMAFQF